MQLPDAVRHGQTRRMQKLCYNTYYNSGSWARSEKIENLLIYHCLYLLEPGSGTLKQSGICRSS